MWPGQSASATNRWKPQVRFSCDESQKLQIGSDTLILTGSAARRQILLPCLSNHLSSVFFFSPRGHPFINIVSGLSSKTDHRNTSRAHGRLPVLKYEKTKHVFEWLVYRTGLHLRQRPSVSSLSVSDPWKHIKWIAVIGQAILASWRTFWIAG